MSATSLSKLISTRKEELARLLEWRGTNFPVVERQNDLRISFIELELEDLEKLNDQPQLNENQQKWINRLTINYSWYGGTAQHALHATLQEPELPDLPQNEFAQVLEVFCRWVQEQEAE